MPKSVIYKRTASKASKNSSTKKSTPRSTSSKKKSWNPLKWFLGLAVILAIPVTIFLSNNNQDLRQRAAGGAQLLLSGPKTHLAPGEETTVSVLLNASTYRVTGVEAELAYEPTKIEVKSVTLGSLLPVKFQQPTISSGTIRFVVGSQVDRPVTGSGVVAQITVRALSQGTTAISFTSNNYVSAVENESSSVLGTTTPINFTIGNGGVSPTVPVPSIIISTGDSFCRYADVNHDGKVSVEDRALIRADINARKTGTNLPTDVNRDGKVDAQDVITVNYCMPKPAEPIITFKSPKENATVTKYGAVKVDVNATHPDGIKSIVLYTNEGNVMKTCLRTTSCAGYYTPKSGLITVTAVVYTNVADYPYAKDLSFIRP